MLSGLCFMFSHSNSLGGRSRRAEHIKPSSTAAGITFELLHRRGTEKLHIKLLSIKKKRGERGEERL